MSNYIKTYIVIPFKYATDYAIFSVVNAILIGVLPILQVYVVSQFIDTAISSYKQEEINNYVYVWIVLLVLLVAYEWLINRVIGIKKIKAEVDLLKKYRMRLVEKASRLEYKYIEDSKSCDLINRTLSSTENKILNNFSAQIDLCSISISIGGIILIVAKYIWWSALLIIILCLPLFIFSIKGGKANYDATRNVSKYERRYNYLHNILVNRENVEERNIFDYTVDIDKKYNETSKKAFWISTKTTLIGVLKTRLSGGLSSVAALIIIVTLIKSTVDNNISVGMFISLVCSIFQLESQLGYGISSCIDTIVQGHEFIKDVEEFENMKEEVDANCLPKDCIRVYEIEFKDVSFKYPGTNNYIIKNMSFILKSGKYYAFVGVNGAGKTTAIKLLTGLYSDYEGKILINRKELKEYTQAEIKGMFSIVHQDFAKYYLSMKENICLGNIVHFDQYDENSNLLNKYIKDLELTECIEKLPQGLNTNLGKIDKKSVDLSGGEWQRVAMVRALINLASVRILDEPTAALDPIMESKMYELFKNMSSNIITLFISHRLGSIKIADEILVFNNGQISEKGSYEEIMKQKGLFYEMYDKQRGWYNE